MMKRQTGYLTRLASIALVAVAVAGSIPGTGNAGPVSKGAAWGAVGGAVVGGITGGKPLAGAAVGAATGAIIGKIHKESKK
jgi:uncharacterized membrane protein